MHISNAIYIYQLILLHIDYLKGSAALVRGKCSSDYEYPEIELLFSCKEETKGKDEINTGAQNKVDIPLASGEGSDNSFQEAGAHRTANDDKLKPWMRQPYSQQEKTGESENGKAQNSIEKLSLSDGVDVESPMNEEEEKTFFQGDEDKQSKPIINCEKDENQNEGELNGSVENKRHRQVKKLMKNFHKAKFQNGHRMFPFRNDKFTADAVKKYYPDPPDNNGKYPYHEEMREIHQKNQEALRNNKQSFNENMYGGPLKSPEYEGHFQEYDELANGKNEEIAVNENVATSEINLQPRETVTGAQLSKRNEGFKSLKEKMEDPHTVMLKRTKNIEVVNKNNEKNEIVNSTKEVPFRTAEVLLKSEVSARSKPPLSIAQDEKGPEVAQSLATSGRKSIVRSNASKPIVRFSNENEMAARPSNRVSSLQENNQLLAKPPVKITNNQLEKHSEEENDNLGVEGHGTKIVKIVPSRSATHPSSTVLVVPTSCPQVGVPRRVDQQNNPRHAETNSALKPGAVRQLTKTKRDAKENNLARPEQFAVELRPSNGALKEKGNSIGSLEGLKEDDQGADGPEMGNCNLIGPQFYSLSKGHSPLYQVSSIMTKFKPSRTFKNNRAQEGKGNESFKRSVPQDYEEEYDSGYYSNRGDREGPPIQAYYDYDNYDADYDNAKDYTSVDRRGNITALANEKETDEYTEERNLANQFKRNRKKFKKQNPRKFEENYRDIFAHPLSLDDPELQIVRGEEAEFVSRHSPHKNLPTRRYKVKLQQRSDMNKVKLSDVGKDSHQGAKPAEQEASIRNHSRKKKGELTAHSRHNKPKGAKELEDISLNEVSNKRRHGLIVNGNG